MEIFGCFDSWLSQLIWFLLRYVFIPFLPLDPTCTLPQ